MNSYKGAFQKDRLLKTQDGHAKTMVRPKGEETKPGQKSSNPNPVLRMVWSSRPRWLLPKRAGRLLDIWPPRF